MISIAAAIALTGFMQAPLPSPRIAKWLPLEMYAFTHFGPNTFTGAEWGKGTENPEVFDPQKLDCRQWIRALKAGGLKGVIITAKHHDGFCLWPSKFSTHTVVQSKWRDGKGDVLRELSEACKAEHFKFGVYLSPWDRNHPSYGTPEYNQTFVNMLKEVLTNYGPVFEVWFDGANGEGPNGKKQVYAWPLFIKTVRECQPNAVIFSDAGPDIRWVGNEEGAVGESNWITIQRDRYHPGTPLYPELTTGDANAPDVVPAECDVSIRPGWFWKNTEDQKVKSVDDLVKIYDTSVARGANLLLNVPPNADGLISQYDETRLREWKQALDARYSKPVSANRVGKSLTFRTSNPVTPSYVRIEEEVVKFGQRIRKFHVEADVDGKPEVVAEGTSVGVRRILPIKTVTAREFRIVVDEAVGEAHVSKVTFFSQ